MMDRADEQTAMIVALETYWKQHPELRLGQLVGILAATWHGSSDADPFYLPDSELFEILGGLIYND